VLRSGAQMDKASEGFKSGEQFAVVAHAARNTDVPFMLLKYRVVEEGKSLETAIHESKPDANVAAEVAHAREQAREDLASISNSGN
jgi:pseudouridine-5'-phosphate glycosidase